MHYNVHNILIVIHYSGINDSSDQIILLSDSEYWKHIL